MRNSVDWFEIPSNNFESLAKFYDVVMAKPLRREVFGGMHHAVFSYEGEQAVSGAVVKMDHLKPSADGTCIYLNVEGRLDDAIEKVKSNGGELLIDKMSIGENGFIAIFKDPDGNRVGLHSM